MYYLITVPLDEKSSYRFVTDNIDQYTNKFKFFMIEKIDLNPDVPDSRLSTSEVKN